VKDLETTNYRCKEIYVGVTHVRATTKITSLKQRMFMKEGRAQNVSELTEMLIIQMR
jgi:hypothetical protein